MQRRFAKKKKKAERKRKNEKKKKANFPVPVCVCVCACVHMGVVDTAVTNTGRDGILYSTRMDCRGRMPHTSIPRHGGVFLPSVQDRRTWQALCWGVMSSCNPKLRKPSKGRKKG